MSGCSSTVVIIQNKYSVSECHLDITQVTLSPTHEWPCVKSTGLMVYIHTTLQFNLGVFLYKLPHILVDECSAFLASGRGKAGHVCALHRDICAMT